MIVEIQIKTHKKQHEAWLKLHDHTTRFVGYGGAASGGKSYLGCLWLIVSCIRYADTRWFLGRKDLKDILQSSFVTFKKVSRDLNIPEDFWSFNGQRNEITFYNGSVVVFMPLAYKPSDSEGHSFGSLEYTGGWIEEAGEVPFESFDILKSRIGRWNNTLHNLHPKMLVTFNPSDNWLFSTFYKPHRDGTLSEEYAFIKALNTDNDFRDRSNDFNLSSISDPIRRMRLKDGLWEFASDPSTLFVLDDILDAFNSVVEIKPETGKYITADVARFGSDDAVISLWHGWECKEIQVLQKRATNVLSEEIRDLAQKNRVPMSNVIVDEDGVGGGVVDLLPGCQGFMGNRSALEEKGGANYANLRSQCFYKLAERFRNRTLAISVDNPGLRDRITEELRAVKRKNPGGEGPLAIIPKELIKQDLGGKSTDVADALMMRVYFDLARPTGGGIKVFSSPGISDYLHRGYASTGRNQRRPF